MLPDADKKDLSRELLEKLHLRAFLDLVGVVSLAIYCHQRPDFVIT